MQVLRLLAARRKRRAVSTITEAVSEVPDDTEREEEEDEGPFFDLDFSSSVRASSSSSSSDESDDASSCSELDFVICLHRSRSASPSPCYHHRHHHEFNCASSDPRSTSIKAGGQGQPSQHGRGGKKDLRTLTFGATKKKSNKTFFYGGRPSFASSTRSLRLFMESPDPDPDPETEDAEDDLNSTKRGGGGGRPFIRRYLASISRRLRSVRPPRPRPTQGEAHSRLRKSRSASAAVSLVPPPPSRRDDSLVEKQDGIAGAIAHCKESFRRAVQECGDSSLLRSRSDPGKCESSSNPS